MSNRLYRLLFGLLLLVALYFDLYPIIYTLMGMAVFEAVTNLRIPLVVSRLRGTTSPDNTEGSLGIAFHSRTNFEAERAWRLLVAGMLAIGLFLFPGPLWFFPWFIGFALLGAGVSGVCPMFLALKWTGMR